MHRGPDGCGEITLGAVGDVCALNGLSSGTVLSSIFRRGIWVLTWDQEELLV